MAAQLDSKLLEAASLAADRLKLPERFLASWFVSENGWSCPSNFNFGNISYQGSGVPSGGVFEGVKSVESNKVCVYESLDAGINAFALLLETPEKYKALTLDLTDLTACGSDIHKMCEVVGASNWAESHYNDGNGNGSEIWDVYNSPSMVAAFKSEVPAKPVTETTTHPAIKPVRASFYIQKGDTLSKLALDHRVPMKALEVVNGISDPDEIQAGEALELPKSVTVQPGDTLSAIAKKEGVTVSEIAQINSIPDTDHIEVGWVLWF